MPENRPEHPPSDRRRLIRRITRRLDLPMAMLSLVFYGLMVADYSAPLRPGITAD